MPPLPAFVAGILAGLWHPVPPPAPIVSRCHCDCDCEGTGGYAATALILAGAVATVLLQLAGWGGWRLVRRHLRPAAAPFEPERLEPPLRDLRADLRPLRRRAA